MANQEISEYLTKQGLAQIPFQGADHAWGYRENEPVFAFIFDPADGSMGFQNAMSLYWATAEYISKPWCLFMVTQTPMMPHNKQMLLNLAIQYNIQLLETPTEEDLVEAVETQIKRLTETLHRYIDPSSENPSLSLGASIKTWKQEKPVLEETTQVKIKIGDLSQYEVNGELTTSRTTVPLMVESGSESIEGILPRLMQVDPLIFYTEHRNLPIVFTVDFESNSFTSRFEADKCNLIEVTSYEALMTAFKNTGEISFIDQNTGNPVFNLSVNEDE